MCSTFVLEELRDLFPSPPSYTLFVERVGGVLSISLHEIVHVALSEDERVSHEEVF